MVVLIQWIVIYQPDSTIQPLNNWDQDKDNSTGTYLTIIPQARLGYESIAHEAEGRVGY